MKKLSLILFLALSFCMISCESETTEKFEEKFTLKQTNKVTSSRNSASYMFSGEYTYDIDYVKGKMNITATDVRFSPLMPIKISFNLIDIKFTYSDNGISFSATNVIPEMDGTALEQYTISKLSGRIITKELSTENIAFMQMELAGSEVTAYPSPMTFDNNCSTIVIKGSDDTHPYSQNESTYTIKLNEDEGTADIFINKAQFNNNMPAMNMAFRNINIEATQEGFILKKDSLTPSIVGSTGEETPNPSFPITNVDGTINGDKLELSFNCTINSATNSQEGTTFLVSAFGNILPNAN